MKLRAKVVYEFLRTVYQIVTVARMLLGYVRDKSKPKPNPPLKVDMMSPEEVRKIGLKIHNADFKHDEYRDLYIKGAHEAVRILNSSEFRWQLLQAKMTEKRGLTNREIYEKILRGADKDGEADFMLDIFVKCYRMKNRRVLGYTYMSTYKTWVNRRYLASLDPNDSDSIRHLAGHICHEYMHNIGFRHDYEKYSSVPYVVGRIVRNVYA